MDQEKIERRLDEFEERFQRIENLLLQVSQKIDHSSVNLDAARDGIKQWVTDYVSLRLQQLVPETCEHDSEPELTGGPYLPGSSIRCTEEVIHRLGRIPIPFVRQMVTQKVAQQAHAEGVGLVDVNFFERAATF
jgi:hypothetical protein